MRTGFGKGRGALKPPHLEGSERTVAVVPRLTNAGNSSAPFGAMFLHYPDSFPREQVSRAWGGRRLTLAFAGGPYLFSGLAPSQCIAVLSRFAGYRGIGRPPTVRTRVRVIDAAAFRRFDLAGWEYTLDFQAGRDDVRFVGLTFVGRLALSPALSGTFWTSLAGEGFFTEGFENYFRVLAAYRLVEVGGALLHSAAVVIGGKGHVFLGPSGTGKTTIAANARAAGFVVLSDDMNAVAPSPTGTVVEKLPFAGELGADGLPARALELGGIYRLRQGPCLALRPLGPAEMVGYAVACAPYLNADPYRVPVLLDNLSALLHRVPTGILEVARDTPFADVAALVEERR